MLPEPLDRTPDQQQAKPTRICPTCDSEFTPDTTERQAFCAPACRPSRQKPELVMAIRTCPQCSNNFTCHPSHRQIYCSPDCRRDSELRRELNRNQERALRLGGAPTTARPEPTSRAELSPAPPPRPAPRQQARTRDPLEPAATRNCPHCDQPITIVALLATPEAARPSIHNRVPDLPSLRRVP
ncbi:hypothetical protein ACFXI0_32660 [Kitasatospora indigofera]|uniref:hypothetical protein n=1 Tax=Kitasatospora indigofera TaxID=67307 RepID=UPI0036A9B3EA